jgi:hypothetical protein
MSPEKKSSLENSAETLWFFHVIGYLKWGMDESE